MSDNIQVAIRIRPLNRLESRNGEFHHWKDKDKSIYQVNEDGQPAREEVYNYDYVFNGESSTEQIYQTSVRNVVLQSLNGVSGTIFTYGQTCSGKTYTMLGDSRSPGVIQLAVCDLFANIAKLSDRNVLLRVACLEIYNETVRDVITGTQFVLRDDNVPIDFDRITQNEDSLLRIIRQAMTKRQTASTGANSESSRSHMIFRITIEYSYKPPEDLDGLVEHDRSVYVAQLNLVDLAGSERTSQTKVVGQHFKEGAYINKSLSTLTLVMRQLSEKKSFISYRDSKLTRLLQQSLGGNATSVVIATITPAAIEETISTLTFALSAKSVKNKPVVNRFLSSDAKLMEFIKKERELSIALQNERLRNESAFEKVQEKEIIISQLKIQLENFRNVNMVRPTRMENRRHTTNFLCRPPAVIPVSTENGLSMELTTAINSTSTNIDSFTPTQQPIASKGVNSSTPKFYLRRTARNLLSDYEQDLEYNQSEYRILNDDNKSLQTLNQQLAVENKYMSQLVIDEQQKNIHLKFRYNQREKELLYLLQNERSANPGSCYEHFSDNYSKFYNLWLAKNNSDTYSHNVHASCPNLTIIDQLKSSVSTTKKWNSLPNFTNEITDTLNYEENSTQIASIVHSLLALKHLLNKPTHYREIKETVNKNLEIIDATVDPITNNLKIKELTLHPTNSNYQIKKSTVDPVDSFDINIKIKEAVERERESMMQIISELETDLNSISEEKDQLIAKLSLTKTELAAKYTEENGKVTKVTKETEILKEKQVLLIEENRELVDCNNSLREDLQLIELEMNDLIISSNQLKTELNQCKGDYDMKYRLLLKEKNGLVESHKKLIEELQIFKVDKNELIITNNILRADVQTKNLDVLKVKTDLESLSESYQKVSKQLKIIEEDNDNLVQANNKLRAETEILTHDSHMKYEFLLKEKRQLAESNNKLIHELQSVEELNSKLAECRDNLIVELQQVKEDNEKFNNINKQFHNYGNLSLKLTEVEASKTKLQDSYNDIVENNFEMQARYTDIANTNQLLQQQLDELQAKHGRVAQYNKYECTDDYESKYKEQCAKYQNLISAHQLIRNQYNEQCAKNESLANAHKRDVVDVKFHQNRTDKYKVDADKQRGEVKKLQADLEKSVCAQLQLLAESNHQRAIAVEYTEKYKSAMTHIEMLRLNATLHTGMIGRLDAVTAQYNGALEQVSKLEFRAAVDTRENTRLRTVIEKLEHEKAEEARVNGTRVSVSERRSSFGDGGSKGRRQARQDKYRNLSEVEDDVPMQGDASSCCGVGRVVKVWAMEGEQHGEKKPEMKDASTQEDRLFEKYQILKELLKNRKQ